MCAISPLFSEGGNPFEPEFAFDADHIDTFADEELGLSFHIRNYHLCEHVPYKSGDRYCFRSIHSHSCEIFLYVDEFYEPLTLEEFADYVVSDSFFRGYQINFEREFHAGTDATVPMMWREMESWNSKVLAINFVNEKKGFCLIAYYPKGNTRLGNHYQWMFRDLMMEITLTPPKVPPDLF